MDELITQYLVHRIMNFRYMYNYISTESSLSCCCHLEIGKFY